MGTHMENGLPRPTNLNPKNPAPTLCRREDQPFSKLPGAPNAQPIVEVSSEGTNAERLNNQPKVPEDTKVRPMTGMSRVPAPNPHAQTLCPQAP